MDASELAERHKVGKEFAEFALSFFVGGSSKEDEVHYARSVAFVEYALSSNTRGRELLPEIISPTTDKELSVLDIGCGYGGMINACTEAGHRALGVEIDENVAKMGQLNLAGIGSTANIQVGDFLTYDFAGQVFDVIICTDAIEHVSSPKICLRRIYDLLDHGGVAHLETVNRRSALNVAADIHMGQFGITLLDHHSASAAAKQVSGWNGYQVSDFWDMEWYLGLGRTYGAVMEAVEPPAYWDVSDAIKNLFVKYHAWRQDSFHRLDDYLQHEIEVRFSQYCQRLFAAKERATEECAEKDFLRRWVSPVIKFRMNKI
ncbi:class I SAM-dependent methyltransferase [Ensifer sp.]|uniref:class I SAM-dependent methyltransferase n=1 Tax=Ensifer sp. TaxID=1872086 RepID=UPI002899CD69|nr:class I SAM-dependent methyltransferase [Ensifer sp.]